MATDLRIHMQHWIRIKRCAGDEASRPPSSPRHLAAPEAEGGDERRCSSASSPSKTQGPSLVFFGAQLPVAAAQGQAHHMDEEDDMRDPTPELTTTQGTSSLLPAGNGSLQGLATVFDAFDQIANLISR